MTRQELFGLMEQAGFSTDWTSYVNAQETVAKYEKLAQLIEARTILAQRAAPAMEQPICRCGAS